MGRWLPLLARNVLEVVVKLSRASSYALHALEYMAALGEDKPVASHHIAAARGIPEGFLLKVLKPLVSARLLQSLKGPHGGYRLARPAAKISLLEVVEAVDGPIRGNAPLSQETGREDGGLDPRLEAVCDQAAALLRKHLGKVRLSDLLSKK
jgi:Rrf2 family protein